MRRFVQRPFLVALAIVIVLFTPVYEAGLLLGWSPAVGGWWSLFVIGLSTAVWIRLTEREERTREGHGPVHPRRRAGR
jgi:hypothetical protein